MPATSQEQRHPYKGSPPRPWIRIKLRAADSAEDEVELLADTGNPCALIISLDVMRRFRHRNAPDTGSNFGNLVGGWVQVVIPEIGFDTHVLGYASDAVVLAAEASSNTFGGLAGLPLLRMMRYGGDAASFWLHPLGP